MLCGRTPLRFCTTVVWSILSPHPASRPAGGDDTGRGAGGPGRPTRLHCSVQVVEGVSKHFVRYPGEDQSAWLLRLSHLHCQNQVLVSTGLYVTNARRQGITKIADLTGCSNITVLYLYNNKVRDWLEQVW